MELPPRGCKSAYPKLARAPPDVPEKIGHQTPPAGATKTVHGSSLGHGRANLLPDRRVSMRNNDARDVGFKQKCTRSE